MTRSPLIYVEVPEKINKSGIKQLAATIVDSALDNNRSLHVAEGLAVMDKLVKAVREEPRFVDAVVEAANSRHTTPNGSVIEVTEVGVQYDYSYDSEWAALQASVEFLTDKRKAREAILRAKAPGKEWVDEDTGEVLSGAPRASRTAYKITLAK